MRKLGTGTKLNNVGQMTCFQMTGSKNVMLVHAKNNIQWQSMYYYADESCCFTTYKINFTRIARYISHENSKKEKLQLVEKPLDRSKSFDCLAMQDQEFYSLLTECQRLKNMDGCRFEV